MHWTRKSIVEKIQQLFDEGQELNYASAEENHLNLVRAASWHFGTWQRAVEEAGLDYASLLKYQRWTRERIIERIRQLHAAGHDLNWRAVSTRIDPALAAAAIRAHGFSSWREAIAAAGLDIDDVARYKHWDEARVVAAIKARHKAGESLSSKSMQESDQSLFCAARRRFGSWDGALRAAGLNADAIRRRKQNVADYALNHLTETKPRGAAARTAGKSAGKKSDKGAALADGRSAKPAKKPALKPTPKPAPKTMPKPTPKSAAKPGSKPTLAARGTGAAVRPPGYAGKPQMGSSLRRPGGAAKSPAKATSSTARPSAKSPRHATSRRRQTKA